MSLFKKKIIVVTHSGTFHSDDVFACATLSLWAEKDGDKLNIVRSREEDIIKKADMVVDVGMEYDPDKDRFDHHQKGGAETHENGIPYASFGLVWKKYGEQICGDKEIVDRVEKYLVMPVDARDNGVNISSVNELNVIDHRTSDMISNLNLTDQEDKNKSYEYFEKAVYFAKEIIKREIVWAKAFIDGEKETLEAIKKQNEPEVLILDRNIEWHEAVSKNKNIKFVVYLDKNGKDWNLQSGRDDLEKYDSDRANLPKNWWGLRGDELVNVSGIEGAIFCANRGWSAVAKTKEEAIEMANKALRNLPN